MTRRLTGGGHKPEAKLTGNVGCATDRRCRQAFEVSILNTVSRAAGGNCRNDLSVMIVDRRRDVSQSLNELFVVQGVTRLPDFGQFPYESIRRRDGFRCESGHTMLGEHPPDVARLLPSCKDFTRRAPVNRHHRHHANIATQGLQRASPHDDDLPFMQPAETDILSEFGR